jgi:hypothetical protein
MGRRVGAITMASIDGLVALIIALVVAWMVAQRAQARRSALVRKKYDERRLPCPRVHFSAPLSARFCAEALARMPPTDHPHPTAAFGNDPFWRMALEWMADRVGGVARRRLYWSFARSAHDADVDIPQDGRCVLIVDPNAGQVTATTMGRSLVSRADQNGHHGGGVVAIVFLDSQPRAISDRERI